MRLLQSGDQTNLTEKLLELEISKDDGLSAFAVAMIIMVISFFVSFVSFVAGTPSFGFIGLLAGIISLVVGLTKKLSIDE